MKFAIVIFFFLTGSISFSQVVDKEVYHLYLDIINSYKKKPQHRPDEIFILIDSTKIFPFEDLSTFKRSPEYHMINLDTKTKDKLINKFISDFDKASLMSLKIPDLFPLESKIQLLSRRTVNNYFKYGTAIDLPKFNRKYKGDSPIIQFSNPYFTPNKKYAVVYLEYYYSCLCAYGAFLLCAKIQNKWVIYYYYYAWVV